MKLVAIALASAFALSSTCAFAHTVRHKSHVRTYPMYRDVASSVVLRPKYGNRNGKLVINNDPGRFHQTPTPTQSFDDPEGKESGVSF
jgi:uncharacterized protein YgiB involved in biofilm formation